MSALNAGIALAGQVPQIAGPLDQYKEAMSVQTLINQHKLQEQEQQSNATQQQAQQLQLQEMQRNKQNLDKFNQVFHDSGGNWDQAIQAAPKAGVDGDFIIQRQQARAKQVLELAQADEANLKLNVAKHDEIAKSADLVANTDPEQQPAAYARERNRLILEDHVDPKDVPEAMPAIDQLKQTANSSKAVRDIYKDAADLKDKQLSAQKTTAEIADSEAKRPGEVADSAMKQEELKAMQGGGVNPKIPLEIQEANAYLKAHPGKGLGDYQRFKATLVPAFNLNMGGLGPGAGGGGGSAAPNTAPVTTPAGEKAEGFNYNMIPPNIRGNVQAILEYRSPMPPQSRSNPINAATRAWVQKLDPTYEEADFPAKNKILQSYTSGKESTPINAVNTALGHVGVLFDSVDALKNNDLRGLNSIANRFGLETGQTPAAVFKTIVHRVGPELTAAYIQGGGGQGERGTTEADFDANLPPQTLKANAAITAKLLRSKIASDENQWNSTYKPRNDAEQFQNRFITPDAKATLNKLSPQGAPSSGGGMIRARDTNGKLHEAPAGTALPTGWTQEK